MHDEPSDSLSLPFWAKGADLLGLAALTLLGGLVVVAVFPGLQTASPAILVGKNALLGGLGAVVLASAAVLAWTPCAARLRSCALPALALALFAGAWLASSAASVSPAYSLREGAPRLLCVLAAAVAPMFLRTRRRIALPLVAVVVAAVVVSATCVSAFAGYRGFNRLAYGIDPRDVIDNPALRDLAQEGALAGGIARSPMRSTFGNPEYVGGFLAVALVQALLAVFGSVRRNCKFAAAAWLTHAAVCGLSIALVQTRSSFIAVGVGLAAAVLLVLPLRGLVVAGLFAVVALVSVTVGPLQAAGVLALGGVAILVGSLRQGRVAEALSEIPRGARFTVGGALVVGLLAVAALSTPGPWNPSGARIVPRLVAAFQGKEDSSRERIVFYMIASEIATRHPLLGVGPGFFAPNFHPSLADIADSDPSGVMPHFRERMRGAFAEFAHNDFFQVAAETGLLGLALLLAALVAVARELATIARAPGHALRADAAIVGGMIATTLGVGLFSGPLHFADRASVFWVTVGCALALIALAKERKPE